MKKNLTVVATAVAAALFISPVMAATSAQDNHKHQPYTMTLKLTNNTGSDLKVDGCTRWNTHSGSCKTAAKTILKNGEQKDVATVVSYEGPADVFLYYTVLDSQGQGKQISANAFVPERSVPGEPFDLSMNTIGYKFKEKKSLDGCNVVRGKTIGKHQAVTYKCEKTLVVNKVN